MKSWNRLGGGTLVAALCVLMSHGLALAQNSIAVGEVTAQAGQTGVVVPIQATTDVPLTLLSVDITFDVALCALIENENLRRAGRSQGDPQEGGLRCPDEGRTSVVILDLLGGTVVPVGSGTIAEWVFDVSPEAASGTYDLGVIIKQLRQGPAEVPGTAVAGQLTIVGAERTSTPTPVPVTPTAAPPTVTAVATATIPMASPTRTSTAGMTPTESGESPTPAEPTATGTAGPPTPTSTPGIAGPGNANCDDHITAADLPALALLLPYGEPREECGFADANGDSQVDLGDVLPTIQAIFGSLP